MNSKQTSEIPGHIALDRYLADPSRPLPTGLTSRRPLTIWQFVVRQWILLLPLATAIGGTAILQYAYFDEHTELLPALFFAAALMITVVMMHQRRMYQTNLSLVERLVINERLTHLHRLSIALNQLTCPQILIQF